MDMISKRILSGFIDYLVFGIFVSLLLFLDSFVIKIIPEIVIWAGVSFFLLKDVLLPAKSIGKFFLSLEIKSRNDNLSLVQCVIRNITLIIWPVEVLLILFTPNSNRIGDYLANTKVVPNLDNRLFNYRAKDYLIAIILAFILSGILYGLITFLF